MTYYLGHFFKKHNIKSQYEILPKDELILRKVFGALYDHPVAVRTADKKLILILSPYRTALSEDAVQKHKRFLYSEPLYHNEANSYCFEYENLAEFKRAIANAKTWL